MPMQVVVEPHNPVWVELFASESQLVAAALGSNVVVIHHIGSTAIPTIYAKPIVDMLIEVADIDAVDTRNPAMAALGYEAMNECGIPGRRYFRKDNEAGIRTHHIHTFTQGCTEVTRHLAFRDFLIAHPAWAQQYSNLKRQLVETHPESIDDYMDGKDEFIKELDQRAARWRSGHV